MTKCNCCGQGLPETADERALRRLKARERFLATHSFRLVTVLIAVKLRDMPDHKVKELVESLQEPGWDDGYTPYRLEVVSIEQTTTPTKSFVEGC